jgi:cytochrome c oxidase subunit 1
MIERIQREGEITFTGKPKLHGDESKAPSQVLTDVAMPGSHDKDNASEQ